MKKEVTESLVAPVVGTKVEEVKKAVVAPAEVKTEAAAEAPKKRGRKSKAEIEELKAAGLYTAKKTTKKATKKAAAKKVVEKKTNLVVQYFGKSVTEEEIVEKVKAAYSAETGKKATSIKVLDIYVKPEENAAYYVVDSKVTGRVDL